MGDFLKEIAKRFESWEDICSLLEIDKTQFENGLSLFQSITWLFFKEIIRKINSNVIQDIENLFPHVVLNNVSLSNLPLQLLMKNENYDDLGAKRRYIFNKAKDVGHRVSCQKVQLYTSSAVSCFQMNLVLHHILSAMKEKVVVCTFNKEIYNNIYKMLEEGELQWTTSITDFIKRSSKLAILLTDYASVRGFEFRNFIFMFDLSQEYMNYRLIEIFTRATTNLHLIVNLVDNKQPKLFECWKTLECVEWRELSFNENMNQFVLKSNSEKEISLESSTSKEINFFNESLRDHYPWDQRKLDEVDQPYLYVKPDGVERTLFIIMKSDDVKLLNEFIKTHSIDRQQYTTNLFGGKTLLHHAVENNAVESSKYLIEEYHRSHNNENERANNRINICPDERNVIKCCKLFVNTKDKRPYNELEFECLDEMSLNGSWMDKKEQWGNTPLHYAAKKNNDTIISEDNYETIVNSLLTASADNFSLCEVKVTQI